MLKCGECGKEIDAIARDRYWSYCSAKCARAADLRKAAK